MFKNRARGPLLAIGLAAAVLASGLSAYAAGMFSTLSGIGAASFCASQVTGAAGQICGQPVPAGPATFAGTEYAPFDIGPLGTAVQAGGSSTSSVNIQQLGQGAALDVTTVNTAATIPAGVVWYYLDGAQASNFTVTMPAAAIEGQFQNVVCEAATAGTLTVAANTGQTLKGNPAVACAIGNKYTWRYSAGTATWFRS